MNQRTSAGISNVVVLASGITDLQVEAIGSNKVKISCPSPDGPFVLARIHRTLASIEGNQVSLQAEQEEQIQAITIEGEEIGFITKDLLCLGGDHCMNIREGWGIMKGLNP